MKILFLDFDGPVIPQRAYAYNIQQRDKWNKKGGIFLFFDKTADPEEMWNSLLYKIINKIGKGKYNGEV